MFDKVFNVLWGLVHFLFLGNFFIILLFRVGLGYTVSNADVVVACIAGLGLALVIPIIGAHHDALQEKIKKLEGK